MDFPCVLGENRIGLINQDNNVSVNPSLQYPLKQAVKNKFGVHLTVVTVQVLVHSAVYALFCQVRSSSRHLTMP